MKLELLDVGTEVFVLYHGGTYEAWTRCGSEHSKEHWKVDGPTVVRNFNVERVRNDGVPSIWYQILGHGPVFTDRVFTNREAAETEAARRNTEFKYPWENETDE